MQLQLRENAEQYSGEKPGGARSGGKAGGQNWRGWLRAARLGQDDAESALCYALFMGLFVADFSALAAAFPAALLCYALLARPPHRRFWQARAGCPLSGF